MTRGQCYTAQQFINAIPGTGGIISQIAERVGCDWHTAKRYIRDYATVKRAYDDEVAGIGDEAESVIIGAIREKDVQTAKWYLSVKRGWVQTSKQEVSGPEGSDIRITIGGLDLLNDL